MNGSRMWWGRARLLFLAATVAAVLGASALAAVGYHLLQPNPIPSGRPSLAPASPGSSLGPSVVGPAARIGERAGTSASLAETSSGPVVTVSTASLGVAAGSTCPPSAIGSIGPGSIDWTSAPGAILQLAGGQYATEPVGLGVSSDCTHATVAVPDGSGSFAISTAPRPLSPDAPFFARKPGDPSTVAAWVPDPLKGGFVSWSVDGGTSWQSGTAARPLGWDDAGVFWAITGDGALARSQGPGFSSPLSGVELDIGATPGRAAADIAAGAVYRDRILVAPAAGGLESVATAGSTQAERSLTLRVWAVSAGRLYVAAVGLDDATGSAMLAVSTDGQRFTTAPLPAQFASASGASVRLLALDDRVLVTDGGQAGIVGVWSIPVSGLPAAPPSPTPAPTATVPSPPPPERTSTWTTVTLPSIPTSGTFGGPGGGFAALPRGGFIHFVPVAADRSIVLTSTDGAAWAQTGEVTGFDALGITGPVAFDGKRYVALGGEGGGGFYGSQSNGAAWVSADLRHWQKAPAQIALGGAEFNGLAAGQNGFVAIGFDAGGQAVWTSPDGLRWTVVNDGRALPIGDTHPTGILHTSHGFAVVGGVGQEAATWTSVDGRRWTLQSPLAAGSGVVLNGLAEGQAGFVSLGSGEPAVEVAPGDFRGPVASWTSSDGVTWHAGRSSPALFGAYGSLVGAPGGYVVAGSVGDDPDGRIWTSTNGIDWVEVAGVALPGYPSVQLLSDGRHVLLIADGDGGLVVLVSDGVQR